MVAAGRFTCRLPACIWHFSHGGPVIVKRVPAAPRPAGRTQAERRAATRGALVAAARALFAERGYAGAAREEIVERAGVTRGALYHHFPSKEDVFRAVYEEVEGELMKAIAAAAMAGTGPVERLRLGSLAFLDAAATPEVRRIVLLDAPAVLPVEVRRQMSERYGLGLVRETLRAAQTAGQLALGPVEVLAPVLLAALHEAATMVAEGEPAAGVRAVVEGLLGLLTGPGPGPESPPPAR